MSAASDVPSSDVPSVDLSSIPADAVLLDVREDYEWQAGHAEGALHVPMNELPARISYDPGPLTPDATIVVTCKMGGRAAQVTAWLNSNGFSATCLSGGMVAWADAGKPMLSADGQPPRIV